MSREEHPERFTTKEVKAMGFDLSSAATGFPPAQLTWNGRLYYRFDEEWLRIDLAKARVRA